MQTSIAVTDFIFDENEDFETIADHVAAAEDLGVDTVWSAEAWGTDAVVPLAFLAARTKHIRLAAGVLQVTARAPAMTAMTAMTLDHVSGGRFALGLGVSGPQVVEGFHGVPYARPLERLRETVEVIRLALAGHKIDYQGQQLQFPLPGGLGKALRVGQPPRPNLPIFLATLGPKSLEYTGAAADGWVGTAFVPERSQPYIAGLRAGAQTAGRSMANLEIDVGGPLAFTHDAEPLVRARKKALAFQLGAMGSATQNFYNDAFSRCGFEEPAEEVQRLWLSGDRKAAAKAVPDELALGTSLFGSNAEVRNRIRAYRSAGVTSLRLSPMGRTPNEKLDALAQALEIVDSVNLEFANGEAAPA